MERLKIKFNKNKGSNQTKNTVRQVNKCIFLNKEKIRFNVKDNKNEQNRSIQNKLGQSYLQKSENRRFKSTRKINNASLPVIFASAPLQSNFVKVSILGKSIDTLVDTGSSLSCIQKSLLDTFDQDFVIYGPSQYKKVKGIGGHLINVSGTVILPVQIGNQLFTQKFPCI